MQKIQIAISSDLCIRLTWNLTGSCGQQQRLCGWSRMVVKQLQDGGRPLFWKSIYRHISVKNVTMFHIVESCPLTKLYGGLSWLHSADEDAVSWLTSYGSWHAYEKKSKWKIIRFSWNFVHSSRFWTGWTSRDQKWKRCIRQTPSLTEHISWFLVIE